MNYIIEILKYIGPFVGVYIGWYLGRKTEKDKIKHEEQKIINSTLFVMLEIRNGLLQLKKIDKSLRIIIPKIKQHPKFNESETIDPIAFKMLLRKMIDNLNGENNETVLNQKFDLCIQNLSEVKPLLAYKINGKQNVRKYVDDWETESRTLINLDNIKDIGETLDHIKPKLIDQIKTDINEIINDIISLIDNKDTKTKIKKLLIEPTEKEFDENLSKNIDKMFN